MLLRLFWIFITKNLNKYLDVRNPMSQIVQSLLSILTLTIPSFESIWFFMSSDSAMDIPEVEKCFNLKVVSRAL